MIYERGDILTLSGNVRYIVVTTLQYEGKDYIYLINENDKSDIMFCEYQGEEFEKVNDIKIVEQLLNIIVPEMKQIIEGIGM